MRFSKLMNWTLPALLLILLAALSFTADPSWLAPALGVVVTAGMSPKHLLEKRGEILKKAKAINDKAHKELRDLTPEEDAQFQELMADADTCQNAVDEMYAQAQAHVDREGAIINAAGGLQTHGINLNQHRGSAASRDLGGNQTEPGQILFRDQHGREIRAYAHNEPMGPVEQEPLDVGRMLYAQLTGRLDTLQPHEIQAMGAGSGDGYLLTPSYGQRIIDLARSQSVAIRAGAMTVNMDTQDLHLMRVVEDPVAHWRHPGNPVTATSMQFGMLTLTARTLAAIIPIHIEWLEDARNAPTVIQNTVMNAMALKLDQAALMGRGAAAEPRGILNTPLVNAISAVGTPTNYSEMGQAVGDILGANYPGEISNLASVMHPRDGETFDQLLDADNNPLRMTPWVEQLQKFHTTSMPTTDGAGLNESTIIVGDFSQVVIGIRKRINVRVLDSGTVTDAEGVTHNAADELKRLLVVYMRADIGVLRPTWLTKLTGVTAS